MLNGLLDTASLHYRDKLAIIDDRGAISYGELRSRINRTARALLAAGVERHATVATCFDNNIENLVLLYAIARIGAKLVTLDITSTPHELSKIAQDADPQWFITEPDCLDAITSAAANAAPQATIISENTSPTNLDDLLTKTVTPGTELPTEEFGGDFIIQYTSGSTGKPKGVVQSQRGLCRRLRNWINTAKLTASHRHLCILTLSHGYGSHCVSLPALSSGGTLHLLSLRKITPRRVLESIKRYKIDCFYALPFFYQLLARTPKSVDIDLTGLFLAMVGSAPVRPHTLEQFHDRFGVHLNNTYGLSEIGIITSDLGPPPTANGTIGRPVEGIEMRIEALPGDNDPEIGELIVRSESFAEGYNASADGPMLRDGWLHTKDLVRRSPDGNLYLVGRRSAFINVSGNKVMPDEIETVLQEIPGVEQAAVIGVPDPTTGERPAAFIIGNDLTETSVRQHCQQRLSSFKVPHHIRFCSEFPTSPAGKIIKTKLSLE